MIRPATHADVPAIVALGVRFLTESGYRALIVPDPDVMARTFTWLLADATRALFVSEQGERITGGIGLFVYPHPYSGESTATELFWYVAPEHRGQGLRLLRQGEAWAREAGATTLQMIAPTPEVERLYQRFGYAQVETAYARTL